MNKLKQLQLILMELGVVYVFHRVLFELKKKTGFFKKTQPGQVLGFNRIAIETWRRLDSSFVIKSRELYDFDKAPDESLKLRVERIKEGQYQFFNATWKLLGSNYNWIDNPDSGYQYPLDHWSDIPSYNSKAGDIKFVWEKSRFGFITDFIRYDYHFGEDNSTFVLSNISDWIDKNPLNHGPNYVCSQETSIRIFHWTIALQYYKTSSYLSQDLLDKILESIYGQVRHVEQNLNFSRKLVRNNHAISECLCLYLIGVVYPFFPNSKKRALKGQRFLEKEILFQVYSDGSYIQHSHNYHRVAIQLFTWYLLLQKNTGQQPPTSIVKRLNKTCDFLLNHLQSNGELPNYGANDGALFFNFNSNAFRDYSPQLAAFCAALNKPFVFNSGGEDIHWYQLPLAIAQTSLPNIARFDSTGYYRLTKGDITVFIRCGNHPNRPSQADNLHMDIWYKGQNVFWDTGTYKYNTTTDNISFFWGTKGHNTVQLGEHDQMLKGARFLWHYWTNQVGRPQIIEREDRIEFQGVISCFRHLGKNITHDRSIVLTSKTIQITDIVNNAPVNLELNQRWHSNPELSDSFDITSDGHISNEEGFHSTHYGEKETSSQTVVTSNNHCIDTVITLQ